MSRRRSAQADAVLDALRHGATYGLAIIRRTGLNSSTVYPILNRMEKAGWVHGERVEFAHGPGRPPRRIYKLTKQAPAA